jgi:hypothetical protein
MIAATALTYLLLLSTGRGLASASSVGGSSAVASSVRWSSFANRPARPGRQLTRIGGAPSADVRRA